jgi:hypothetical protein
MSPNRTRAAAAAAAVIASLTIMQLESSATDPDRYIGPKPTIVQQRDLVSCPPGGSRAVFACP